MQRTDDERRCTIGIYGDRQTVIDDGVSKRLTLKRGPNIVRAAIVNGGPRMRHVPLYKSMEAIRADVDSLLARY